MAALPGANAAPFLARKRLAWAPFMNTTFLLRAPKSTEMLCCFFDGDLEEQVGQMMREMEQIADTLEKLISLRPKSLDDA
jgi:hypothetical protein